MAIKTTRFDPADYLRDEQDIANYLSEIAEDGSPELIASALGDVARARNMSQLARDAGISRVGLIKALSSDGNPSFATIAKVVAALGLKITFSPAKSS